MAIINPINAVKANRYVIEELQEVPRMESPRILSNLIPLAAKFIDQPEPGMGIPDGFVLLAPDHFKHLHETIGFSFNRPHLVFRRFELEGEHSERGVWKLGN